MLSQESAVNVISFLLTLLSTACNQGMTWSLSTYFPDFKTKGNKIIYFNCSKKTKQFQEHRASSSSTTVWPYSSDTRGICPFKNHFTPFVLKGLKHVSVIFCKELVNEEHNQPNNGSGTITTQCVINWSINTNFRLPGRNAIRNCFKVTLFNQRFSSFLC